MPAVVVAVARLPITAHGKVDRKALLALPRPDEGDRAFVEPRTLRERQVAAIWREQLGVERVGATDDFFALGGHSLLATRVTARLSAVLGIDVPLALLFAE